MSWAGHGLHWFCSLSSTSKYWLSQNHCRRLLVSSHIDQTPPLRILWNLVLQSGGREQYIIFCKFCLLSLKILFLSSFATKYISVLHKRWRKLYIDLKLKIYEMLFGNFICINYLQSTCSCFKRSLKKTLLFLRNSKYNSFTNIFLRNKTRRDIFKLR